MSYSLQLPSSPSLPDLSTTPEQVIKQEKHQALMDLQYIYNLSLTLAKVPSLCKTSLLVQVPKKKNLRDYSPVVLTSHLISLKGWSWLPVDTRGQRNGPPEFVYRLHMGVEDAVI